MKKGYLKLVLVYWLLMTIALQPAIAGVASWGSRADGMPLVCKTSKKTTVFFANGMNNDFDIARDSLNELKREVQAVLPGYLVSNNNVKFDLAYNEQENWLVQLVEVANQQENDNWASSFYHWLTGALDMPGPVELAFRNLVQTMKSADYVLDADLQRHVTQYRNEIAKGRKVIVVAHSQGNFYANEASSLIGYPTAFGVVAVGTPANKVARGGPHTTLTDDKVMNWVRLIDSNTLPAEITNTFSHTVDKKSHDFIRAYLDGNVSGPKVINDTLEQIKHTPGPGAGNAVITIPGQIAWEGQRAKFQLHFEDINWGAPSIDHGPSRAYKCDALREGSFSIGISFIGSKSPLPELCWLHPHVSLGIGIRDLVGVSLYIPDKFLEGAGTMFTVHGQHLFEGRGCTGPLTNFHQVLVEERECLRDDASFYFGTVPDLTAPYMLLKVDVTQNQQGDYVIASSLIPEERK